MRSLLAALCLFVLTAPALAQEEGELPPVTYPDIVMQAGSLDGFVPEGWKIEFRAEGDLNGDGKADAALVLRGTDEKNVLINPPLGPERFDTNPRILMVALAEEGGFRRALANHTLIARPDNPSQEDSLAENGGVSIERGSLVVAMHLFMSAGGSDMGNSIFRFRLEKDRFRLIGFDGDSVNRMSGAMEEVSVNYLTGKVIVKAGSIENDEMTSETKRLKSKKALYIEDLGDGLSFDPEY